MLRAGGNQPLQPVVGRSPRSGARLGASACPPNGAPPAHVRAEYEQAVHNGSSRRPPSTTAPRAPRPGAVATMRPTTPSRPGRSFSWSVRRKGSDLVNELRSPVHVARCSARCAAVWQAPLQHFAGRLPREPLVFNRFARTAGRFWDGGVRPGPGCGPQDHPEQCRVRSGLASGRPQPHHGEPPKMARLVSQGNETTRRRSSRRWSAQVAASHISVSIF